MILRFTHKNEEKFAIFAIIFFSSVLNFNSVFTPSEGLGLASSPNSLVPILSLIQHTLFIVTFLMLLRRPRSTTKTVFRSIPIFALVLIYFFSFLWSDDPSHTLRRSFSLFETSVFGIYLASAFSLRNQLKIYFYGLSTVILISILFILVFPTYGVEQGIHYGALRGPLEHKNFFGRLMSLCTIVFLISKNISLGLSSKYKVFALVSAAILTFLSDSKTSLGILLVSLSFILFISFFRIEFRLATAIQSIYLMLTSWVVFFVTYNADMIAGASGRDLTFSGRTYIWSGVWEKIKERIFLGYGYEGFWNLKNSIEVSRLAGNPTYLIPHAHNGFLELLLAVGLVGFIVFWVGFILTFHKWLTFAMIDENLYAKWGITFLVFLVLNNLGEPSLVNHNSIFWVMYVSLTATQINRLGILTEGQ